MVGVGDVPGVLVDLRRGHLAGIRAVVNCGVVLRGGARTASHRRQHDRQDADGDQHHRDPSPVAAGWRRPPGRSGPAPGPHVTGLSAHVPMVGVQNLRTAAKRRCMAPSPPRPPLASSPCTGVPCAPAPAARGRRRRGSPTTTPPSGCGSMTFSSPDGGDQWALCASHAGRLRAPQGWTQVDRRVASPPRFEPPAALVS